MFTFSWVIETRTSTSDTLDLDDLIDVSTSGLSPAHDAIDADKVATLVASMLVDGWVGPPLVVDGEQALTGSHRLAAVDIVEQETGSQIGVPRVELAELCVALDVDLDAIREDVEDIYGLDMNNWYRVAVEVADALPTEVVEALGMDLH